MGLLFFLVFVCPWIAVAFLSGRGSFGALTKLKPY